MSNTQAARIAWHDHQNEHHCHGRECAEAARLYAAYLAAGDEEGPAQPRHAGRPRPAEDWTAEAHDAYERHRDDRPAKRPRPRTRKPEADQP
jgi:hypothetical protein